MATAAAAPTRPKLSLAPTLFERFLAGASLRCSQSNCTS